MRTLLKIAWRNIWRNRKRTVLTMLSIIFAVFFSIFSRSLQLGTFGQMIDNTVKLSTGYIQIHQNGYWKNKTINETFEQTDSLVNIIRSNKNVDLFIPRLESFALASSGEHTKGAMIIGTEPEIENKLNKYSEKIIKGKYLNNYDKSIIIGDELASYLKVGVGDTLILLGQGYHGVTAAAQYTIKGILHFPIPDLNKQLILMPLSECQYLYASENRISSLSIMLKNSEDYEKTAAGIAERLSEDYEIMTWEEMNKELVQFIDTKLIGGIIMLSILYIVIGFGVFGTVMMMTMERRKEFAIMISIGMKKIKLLLIVLLETLMIGTVAIMIGIFIVYPLLSYLSHNPLYLTGAFADSMKSVGAEPIIPFVNRYSMYVNQLFSVILITMVAIIYPLIFILKFNVLKAMRS